MLSVVPDVTNADLKVLGGVGSSGSAMIDGTREFSVLGFKKTSEMSGNTGMSGEAR